MSNGTRIIDLMYTRGSASAPVYYLLRVHKFNEDRYRGERAFRTRFKCIADGFAKVNTREKSSPVCRMHMHMCICACGVILRERGEKCPVCREFEYTRAQMYANVTISNNVLFDVFYNIWYMIRESNILLYPSIIFLFLEKRKRLTILVVIFFPYLNLSYFFIIYLY